MTDEGGRRILFENRYELTRPLADECFARALLRRKPFCMLGAFGTVMAGLFLLPILLRRSGTAASVQELAAFALLVWTWQWLKNTRAKQCEEHWRALDRASEQITVRVTAEGEDALSFSDGGTALPRDRVGRIRTTRNLVILSAAGSQPEDPAALPSVIFRKGAFTVGGEDEFRALLRSLYPALARGAYFREKGQKNGSYQT